MSITQLVPRPWRLAIKARLKQARIAVNSALFSYGKPELLRTLRRIGVQPGDALMLHSSFSREYGFRGTINDLIDTFLEAVGPEGHLLMVSLPYRTSSLDWLEAGRRFDVRKTPSMMGMVSEVFRRQPGVRRSLHPTHPVLVLGPQPGRFIDGHSQCRYPCGPGSPFEALLHADGKVLFFNAPVESFTFFHYLEHVVHESLPFPLYTAEPFLPRVVDVEGRESTVPTHPFTREAIQRRRAGVLHDAMRARGSSAEQRIGASKLVCYRVQDALDCTRELQAANRLFFEFGPLPAKA